MLVEIDELEEIEVEVLHIILEDYTAWYDVPKLDEALEHKYQKPDIEKTIDSLGTMFPGIIVEREPYRIREIVDYRATFRQDEYSTYLAKWLYGEINNQSLMKPHNYDIVCDQKITIHSPTIDSSFRVAEWIRNNHPKFDSKGQLDYSIVGYEDHEIIYKSYCPKCRAMRDKGIFNSTVGRDHREHKQQKSRQTPPDEV